MNTRRKIIFANFRELKKLADLENKYTNEKTYQEILNKVLANLPVINNQKLCEILSNETNTQYFSRIKQVPPILHKSKITLSFQNRYENIEVLHSVNKDVEKLSNINWFKFITEETKKVGDSLVYTDIVDAPSDVVDDEYVMPVALDKTIQKALTNYIDNFNMIEYASTIDTINQTSITETSTIK